MNRLGKRGLLLALVVLLLGGGLIAQQAAADHCWECFYELCIPVPLGYGWADCRENVRVCREVMVVPPMPPDQDAIYGTECREVCKMQGQPCFQLTDPG